MNLSKHQFEIMESLLELALDSETEYVLDEISCRLPQLDSARRLTELQEENKRLRAYIWALQTILKSKEEHCYAECVSHNG